MIDYARGRVAGGCSAINGTIALRGMPSDYQDWADRGNPEWAWEKVLPYFRRIEDDRDFGDRSEVHGRGGPLPIVRWTDDELDPAGEAVQVGGPRAGLSVGRRSQRPMVQRRRDRSR